jgi:UDP-N-acetylmuramoyl-tripeptide--D-alanyl-D-alanine ligase
VNTAAFSLEEVLAATGGELAMVGAGQHFQGVTVDSRAVASGQVFVAVRGDTHDGHQFAAAAGRQGAGLVVVETVPADLPPHCGAVVVRDALHALGDLAAAHRRRFRTPMVGITGSNGKTTTKELLATVFETAYGAEAVLRTVGTQNNLVGLPLTLLRLDAEDRVAVLEMGMNGPVEIWRMADIAAPDVGVVTCVAAAHLEGLGTLHGIAEAKSELYRRLRPSSVAVVNADDPLVAARARVAAGRVVRFGIDADAEVRAVDLEDAGLDGTRFSLQIDATRAPVRLQLPGRHNVTNALAAAAAASAVGVPATTIAAGLSTARGPAMRLQRVELRGGVTVVNDAYNANPASMRAALATLAASVATRRIAVLGDMRELGTDAALLHHDLGRAAGAAGLAGLYVLGDHAGAVRDGALAVGFAADRIVVGRDHADLAHQLGTALRPGDVVLIKGSRGSAMERILRHLETEVPS